MHPTWPMRLSAGVNRPKCNGRPRPGAAPFLIEATTQCQVSLLVRFVPHHEFHHPSTSIYAKSLAYAHCSRNRHFVVRMYTQVPTSKTSLNTKIVSREADLNHRPKDSCCYIYSPPLCQLSYHGSTGLKHTVVDKRYSKNQR